jgi:hypothetical protein
VRAIRIFFSIVFVLRVLALAPSQGPPGKVKFLGFLTRDAQVKKKLENFRACGVVPYKRRRILAFENQWNDEASALAKATAGASSFGFRHHFPVHFFPSTSLAASRSNPA